MDEYEKMDDSERLKDNIRNLLIVLDTLALTNLSNELLFFIHANKKPWHVYKIYPGNVERQSYIEDMDAVDAVMGTYRLSGSDQKLKYTIS